MATIALIHGPNLNMLGAREPGYYGSRTLDEINQHLIPIAETNGHQLTTFQSNAEHGLIDHIQQFATNHVDLIIINPAAYTHTSIALRDALLAVAIPFIEVHLSNLASREAFRQSSYFSDIALGVISGFGTTSYELALQAAIHYLES